MAQALDRSVQLAPVQKRGRLATLWRQIKINRANYLLLAPFATVFFVFTVLPVIMSVVLSFTHYNMLQPPVWVGWANYIRLFLADDVFLIAVKNTFVFASVTGPVSYFACLIFAWMINELKPKLRAFLTLLFYAPSISGNLFLIWTIIFSSDSYGLANGFLMRFGIATEPIQWLQDPRYMMAVIILIVLWLSLGTSFLVFIAGLQGIDKSLYEAGAIDGVKNRWQELWFITLPSMRPQLMFGAVISITQSFSVAGVTIALAGFPSTDYAARTVVTHLIDYGSVRFEMGYASSIATVLFFAMVLAQRVVQYLLRKMG